MKHAEAPLFENSRLASAEIIQNDSGLRKIEIKIFAKPISKIHKFRMKRERGLQNGTQCPFNRYSDKFCKTKYEISKSRIFHRKR